MESDIHLVETHQVRTTALHQIALGNLDSGASAAWFDARGNAATYLLDCEFRQTANLEIARAFTAYQHYELVRTLPGDLPWNLDLIILPCVASFYCDEDVPDAEGEHYPESARGMPVNWKKEPLNGLTSYEVPRGNARPHASKETAHASVLSDSRREAWGGCHINNGAAVNGSSGPSRSVGSIDTPHSMIAAVLHHTTISRVQALVCS